ncbi:RHS repeat domain-containing protein, partial [Neisseria macacae]
ELGNLIHRELANGEVQNYFYDLHDQLVKAEIFKKDGSKETWSYTYDALGRRIGKGRLKNEEVSNDLENQTRFVWDGSHLLQEIHPDGRYTYIYTDQDSYEPLAQVRNWTTEDGENRHQTHYFHCDQIGIPREMTDKDGNLLWFGNYTGWGRLKEETKVTDSAYQPFRLQNQYADRETGLHYNFFRYYEPDVGRFVNQDPIGLMGGMNLYQFAPNTQQWIDHLGLDVNIIRSDRSVTFILDISLNGRNVTNTDIENVKNGIERNWNAGGWKYGGCNIRFIANVKANDSKMANQITAEPINGRSYVNKAGGNRGVWYMRDPNVSWVAAHEAGHLMGLGDRYKDINGKSIPQKGWENNIMAAPNKPVEQRNINELIPFTTKCACNILEYM